MNYFFHPAAEAEHLESVAFYEVKHPGLGAEYLTEFEKVMTLVCQRPHLYPIAKNQIFDERHAPFPLFCDISRKEWAYPGFGCCS